MIYNYLTVDIKHYNTVPQHASSNVCTLHMCVHVYIANVSSSTNKRFAKVKLLWQISHLRPQKSVMYCTWAEIRAEPNSSYTLIWWLPCSLLSPIHLSEYLKTYWNARPDLADLNKTYKMQITFMLAYSTLVSPCIYPHWLYHYPFSSFLSVSLTSVRFFGLVPWMWKRSLYTMYWHHCWVNVITQTKTNQGFLTQLNTFHFSPGWLLVGTQM